MNYVFRFIFVFISLQFYVTLVHSKAGSYILPEAADVIDVTKAPFYADNSGKTDCSTALQKAFTYAATETNGIFTKDKRAVQIIYFPAGTY
ncbi:MAG TPA: glycoside hydrolase family 55 protein [Bacteroides mediterraneensis]|uniref:glycosyl hydrolase family 28-related protein n=1 Tax=Bacteroides mediterraneensis TaxID=1841856 RepID=UPI0026EDCFCF|nr:glycosyl hydrolase family 28-related protein [Bacteroides mediterraneensis]HJH63529.1 glycoside hydrolase family 55 protein [Bacteroides mediterraneensis]